MLWYINAYLGPLLIKVIGGKVKYLYENDDKNIPSLAVFASAVAGVDVSTTDVMDKRMRRKSGV